MCGSCYIHIKQIHVRGDTLGTPNCKMVMYCSQYFSVSMETQTGAKRLEKQRIEVHVEKPIWIMHDEWYAVEGDFWWVLERRWSEGGGLAGSCILASHSCSLIHWLGPLPSFIQCGSVDSHVPPVTWLRSLL